MMKRDMEDEIMLEESFLDGDVNEVGTDDDIWDDASDSRSDDSFEGQLAVDVFQTKDKVIIKAPIAGVPPEMIDVEVAEDVVTIRGTREEEKIATKDNYYIRECFWGKFSRSIVLPTAIVAEKAEARTIDGVLRIEIPKVVSEKTKKIKVLAG